MSEFYNEFYNLVEHLTRERKVAVTTDNGLVFATEDGLIQQLRDAIHNSGDRGATSANKAKLPINAPAVDLLTLIDRQVSEVWGKVTNRIPNTDRTEKLLAEWAGAVKPDSLVVVSSPEIADGLVIWTKAEYQPIDLLARWTQQIEDLFDPPRTAEILAPCIACGEREVWRTKDGESARQSALVFVRDRVSGDSTEARCLACGTSWAPALFGYLAEAITANVRHTETEGMTTV